MATYTKVGPHNWTFRIRHTDKRTKQKKEFKRSGFYSKPDAEIAAADLKKQLDLGYKENNQETVVECIGRWLKTYKLGKVAKNTYQLHQSNLKNHIAPYFQKLLVTDFSHPLYQEFINHLIEETKLSKRSIEII
ncbi:MAG: integration/recombination/inversion protein, partial [Neobacillus sp.]|nr:integration/recombination/inversion protein [Neobacillus sp.]